MTNTKAISPLTIIVSFVFLAITGAFLLPQLVVKLMPSQTAPTITVSYTMPMTNARIIEAEVTSKLESTLSRVKGIKNLYSKSGIGRGAIVVELDNAGLIEVARFEISNIIRQTWPELPKEVTYPMITVNQLDELQSRPFISLTLNSAESPITIQNYATNTIKNALNDINGLDQIQVTGAQPMEWRLTYDLGILGAFKVTLNDIREAIAGHYRNQFIGMSEAQPKGGTPSSLRVSLTQDDKTGDFDPTKITVKNINGALIGLDRLVTTTYTAKLPTSYYRINGLNSIYINLSVSGSTNQISIAEEVKARLKSIKSRLPSGYMININYDATDYIRKEIDRIYLSSAMTILLLLSAILIYTRNIRVFFIITASLLVSSLICVVLYYLLSVEMHMFSLAGITIALNLVAGIFFLTARQTLLGNGHKFLFTTIGSAILLITVFAAILFFDEATNINFKDFSLVVIINLIIALPVAYLFIPAVLWQLSLNIKMRTNDVHQRAIFQKMRAAGTRLHLKTILFLARFKGLLLLALIFLFGLPIHLLPEEIKGDNMFALQYNQLTQTETYKEDVKPLLWRIFGGGMRLFTKNIYNEQTYSEDEEIMLTITSTMPIGTSLAETNDRIVKVERFLSKFPQIRQIQTSIKNPQRASIDVYFLKDQKHGRFPYELKEKLINKALEFGGGSWSIQGLHSPGFSNTIGDEAGQYRIKIYGYNYDELYGWADTLKKRLLKYRRNSNVNINSHFTKYTEDYQEFYFSLNKEQLAKNAITPVGLFDALKPVFLKDLWTGSIPGVGQAEDIILTSSHHNDYNRWRLMNMNNDLNEQQFKLDVLATIEKDQTPSDIVKENQQYFLTLQYSYLGWRDQGMAVLDKELDQIKKKLPMGYVFEKQTEGWNWNSSADQQYIFFPALLTTIYLILVIFFNSFRYPFILTLAALASYIGIFFTSYYFKLSSNQGMIVSFIISPGLTLGAALFLINEYRSIFRINSSLKTKEIFVQAWQQTRVPILIYFSTTTLSFLPFLLMDHTDPIWVSMAACTIGATVASLLATFLALPVYLISHIEK